MEEKVILYDRISDSFFLNPKRNIDQLGVEDINTPLSIGWLITGRCNLQCLHCYGNQEELPQKEISTKEAKSICENIIQAKIQRVSLSGGEPMTRTDIFDIIKHLSKAGVSVILSTNGLLVKENIHELSLLRHLEISLDGSSAQIHDTIRPSRTPTMGSFSKAIEAIKASVGGGILTRVLTTLNQHNYQDLHEIGSVLVESGVQEWHIGKTTNAGRARFIYQDLMQNVEFSEAMFDDLQKKFPTIKIQFNFPSKASKYYALILPDGHMYTQDYISGEKIKLGSLVETPISTYRTETNYDIKGHYIKRLNINPSLFT